MNDILADWKETRFVFYKHPTIINSCEFSVLLLDYVFWAEHIPDLEEWCQKYNCSWSGMVVNVPDERTLTIFVLKWS